MHTFGSFGWCFLWGFFCVLCALVFTRTLQRRICITHTYKQIHLYMCVSSLLYQVREQYMGCIDLSAKNSGREEVPSAPSQLKSQVLNE